MKKFIKTVCFIFILALMLTAFAACERNVQGNGDDTSADAVGKTETWGNISVYVPAGCKLIGGSLVDGADPDSLSIKSDDGKNYYIVTVLTDEAKARDSIAATKEKNPGETPEEVTLDVDGTVWSGIAYKHADSSDSFQMWAKTGNKTVLVGADRHAYDSDETREVLGSIKIAG
ncbi:MAG: hypothetical protein IJS45_03655 [Clostridia bacterium]|nr:hypothetical protein [Clostridia bacterium]